MAETLPSFVLKNVTLFLNGGSQIGQVSELTLPVVEFKKEEMQNAGMIKPREVIMGLNATSFEAKFTGIDPSVLKLHGYGPGDEIPIIAYGYMQDEGTDLKHENRCEMQTSPSKWDAGTWAASTPSPVDTAWSVHSFKLFGDDDEEIASVNDFGASFGGKEIFPGMADALRLR